MPRRMGRPFGAHIYGPFWTTTPVRLEPGKPCTLSAWVKSDIPARRGSAARPAGGSGPAFRARMAVGAWSR
jgi:hypothetical protein